MISLFSFLIHFLNRDLIDVGLDQYGSDDDEDEAASSSRQLHIDLDSSIEERSQVLAETCKDLGTCLVRLHFFFSSA